MTTSGRKRGERATSICKRNTATLSNGTVFTLRISARRRDLVLGSELPCITHPSLSELSILLLTEVSRYIRIPFRWTIRSLRLRLSVSMNGKLVKPPRFDRTLSSKYSIDGGVWIHITSINPLALVSYFVFRVRA